MPFLDKLITTLVALASTGSGAPVTESAGEGNQTQTNTIKWAPCDIPNMSLPAECGNLSVPLDYSDPMGNATLSLAVVRVAARRQPAKGSVIFNFGGPGYGGVVSLAQGSRVLMNLTGGDYDLVSFDPRGTAGSRVFSCFGGAAERSAATALYPIQASSASDVALGRTWLNAQVINGMCAQANRGGYGELVGTAFAARDVMRVVDAVERDGMLRYWGISYGTVLGATLAAMFPERIDRMVLDSVANAHNYYRYAAVDVDSVLMADATLRGVLDECVKAGAAKCPLAALGSSAVALEALLARTLDELKYAPLLVNGSTIIDNSFLLNMLVTSTKYPGPLLNQTRDLANVIKRENLLQVVAGYTSANDAISMEGEGVFGIKCSDAAARYKTLAEAEEGEIEYVRQTSRFSADGGELFAAQCGQWPFRAKEVYGGDFRAKTRRPLLFVGNTYDVVTPIVSAKNMSSGFEGSVVVEQQGFGHGITRASSVCMASVLAGYFANATLPKDGLLCPVETKLFP